VFFRECVFPRVDTSTRGHHEKSPSHSLLSGISLPWDRKKTGKKREKKHHEKSPSHSLLSGISLPWDRKKTGKKREKRHHEKSPSHGLLSGISTVGALDGAEGASLYT
jgi:hypothetical protein